MVGSDRLAGASTRVGTFGHVSHCACFFAQAVRKGLGHRTVDHGGDHDECPGTGMALADRAALNH